MDLYSCCWMHYRPLFLNIEHNEPRVRSLIARTVGAFALITTGLATRYGNQADMREKVDELQVKRREVHDAILKSLKFHFEVKVREAEIAGKDVDENGEKVSKASDGALDDTTGWRALETNLHALAGYIDGNSASSNKGTLSYVSEQSHLFTEGHWFLEGLQYCSITHVNRHVRAASSAVLGTLVTTLHEMPRLRHVIGFTFSICHQREFECQLG